MSLESLKITECPAAFADMARKHNALVALIATMTGANGLKVTVSEKNLVLNVDINALATAIAAKISEGTALTDAIIDAVGGYFTAVEVEVCDVGTISVLTDPEA